MTTSSPGFRNDGSEPLRLSVSASLALLTVLTLAVVWWGGLAPSVTPPPVVPRSAPATEFSAERARRHLRQITRQPRSVGSEGHARTRSYLIDQLEGLGLEPEVQRATGIRRRGSTILAADAVNFMARIEGTRGDGAVVLTAHYDSEQHSPGAADAGNGVAAVLETARALLAGPPLDNDVILLFPDAEEVGLLGAKAFVDEHPWAADIGIVLNAEGRGNAGPVHMFRTAGGNGNMIRILAQSVPRPSAESLSSALFELMPNDTDLTIFDQSDHPGMDFANSHGLTHYHTPMDSYERADPRSLQHHGEYLLHLARAFGGKDLASIRAPDRVYFTAPLVGLVHYPAAWAPPLAVLATLAFLAVAWRAWRREFTSPGRVALGATAMLVLIIVLTVLATFGWNLLRTQVPEYPWFGNGAVYHSTRYLAGFCLLTVAAFVTLVVGLRRWLRVDDLFLGAALIWASSGLAAAWWLPGATYLLLWPLLFALAGYLCLALRPGPTIGAVVVAVGSLPVIIFFANLVVETEVAMTLDKIAAPVGFTVLALGLLVLAIDAMARPLRWRLPAGIALAGVVVLGWALWDTGFDADHKKPNSVEYIADLSAGEAAWYSLDPEPDVWTRQFLGPDPARDGLPEWAPAYLREAGRAWHRPAGVRDLDAPDARVMGVQSIEGEPESHVQVTSPRGTYATVIEFGGPSGVPSLTINDREVPGSGAAESDRIDRIIHYGMDEPGVELRFTAEDPDQLELVLRANRSGLPQPEQDEIARRPDHMMTAGPTADRTRVQRTVRLSRLRQRSLVFRE